MSSSVKPIDGGLSFSNIIGDVILNVWGRGTSFLISVVDSRTKIVLDNKTFSSIKEVEKFVKGYQNVT